MRYVTVVLFLMVSMDGRWLWIPAWTASLDSLTSMGGGLTYGLRGHHSQQYFCVALYMAFMDPCTIQRVTQLNAYTCLTTVAWLHNTEIMPPDLLMEIAQLAPEAPLPVALICRCPGLLSPPHSGLRVIKPSTCNRFTRPWAKNTLHSPSAFSRTQRHISAWIRGVFQ